MPNPPIKGLYPALSWLALAMAAHGMQITGFDPEVHNRFASGFPASPVRNTDESFIGKDFDWTSLGWNSGNPRQGYGFLSPRHHLTAKHFNNTNSRRIFGNDHVIHTSNHQATVDLGLGVYLESLGPDISVTRLATAMPASAGMPRHPVLDLNSSSSTNSTGAYTGRSVYLYGHWGWDEGTGSTRIAETTISSVVADGTDHLFSTPRTVIQLEGNDSGSPAYLVWTDPDGGRELAIIGNHVAINETHNFHNFISSHQVMTAMNTVMTPDGYALRVEGEPADTWVGVQNISINNRQAWGVSAPAQAPSDRFVTFDGLTAGNGRQVNVNANHNLRGLYFRNTASDSLGFHFGGTSTLTIGRGGVCNLDGSRQIFEAPLALGDHQYWDAGTGGISVRNIATNGRLLNIRSAGPSVIRGNLSGSGGIALEGGQLHIEADSTYTGKTWGHHGALRVDGDIRTSEKLLFGPAATLTGHGKVPEIQGRGAIEPDGILTAESLAPEQGMSLHVRFPSNAPVFESAATSPNDVLRLTGSPALSSPFDDQNAVSVYLANAPSNAATTLTGGIFLDDPAAPLTLVSQAEWQVHVADPGGSITHRGMTYSPLDRAWSVALVPRTAAFADGSVDGLVLQLEIAPKAGTYDAWAASAFPEHVDESDRAPDVSPIGDGVPNLLAYALGLDPMADKSGGMPEAELSETHLIFRFRRNTDAADLSRVVEMSDDLVEWTNADAEAVIADPDVDDDGRVELLEVMIPRDPFGERRFARLKVNFSPN